MKVCRRGAAASGVAWASIPAGVGGANGVDFNDSVKARFGDGNDLEIFHNGVDSVIKDAGTGSLEIRATDLKLNNSDNSKNMIKAIDGGAVELYHNGTKKAETTQYGFDLPGDNFELRLGASNDLKIWHDSTNSQIKNDTGALKFRSASYYFRSNDDAKNSIVASPTAQVDL